MKKVMLVAGLALGVATIAGLAMIASNPVNAAPPTACLDGAPNGVVDEGEECDDGNTTQNDCCNNKCQAKADGFHCSDGNACTDGDSCTAGACVGGAAVADGELCDDGNDCTDGDSCTAGSCVSGADAADGTSCDTDCILNGDCTAGVCGGGKNINEGGTCDDGDECTSDDICTEGACAGIDIPDCTPGTTGGTTGGTGDEGGCSLIR